MPTLLERLNEEMGEVTAEARRSLVQVRNGKRGFGSGTIWHPDGLIITNAHVVNSHSPQVVLPDGSTQTARVLAHDSNLDVAALMVDASGLPPFKLGDSKSLRTGQWVTALGHPRGVAGAVTGGVVIGVGSDFPEMPLTDREWIAVGLRLRPGHSGGPLVDAEGRLVGINTMMVGPKVGMALPIHVIKDFLTLKLGSTLNSQKNPSMGESALNRIGSF